MTNSDLAGLVAGAGSIGERHARNLQELGVDVALSDPDPEARERVGTNLDLRAYPSLSDALESETPAFVVVATPTSAHVDVAIEAAEAGAHLFVEKPLSHEMADVDTLESLVEAQGLVTLVGCNLRFQPEIRKVHELVQSGIVGNVVSARIEGGSYLPGWYPDRDYAETYSARADLGGGVILDYIHEINYARWMLGEFASVVAEAGQRSHLDVETNDVAAIIATAIDGTICEFHLDYVQRSYSRSCHVIGEEGTIRWSWPDERVEWYVAADDEWYEYERPSEWETNDMYVEEMEHFLACIREDSESTCPIACGSRDLAVALAARESATTGRRMSIHD